VCFFPAGGSILNVKYQFFFQRQNVMKLFDRTGSKFTKLLQTIFAILGLKSGKSQFCRLVKSKKVPLTHFCTGQKKCRLYKLPKKCGRREYNDFKY